MIYNTKRKALTLPEYGRNVHQMVDFIKTIDDRDERTTAAKGVVKLMKQMQPQVKELENYEQKLWDHFFIMADYDLDIDAPFPIPTREHIEKRPDKVEYQNNRIRFRHYGSNVENIISKAVAMEEGEEKTALVSMIANMMKRFYLQWNRDSVTDDVIWDQLNRLSKGKIKKVDGIELTSTNEILKTTKKKRKPNNNKNHRNNNNKKKR